MEKLERQKENRRNGKGNLKANSIELHGAKNMFQMMNDPKYAVIMMEEEKRVIEIRKRNRSVSGSQKVLGVGKTLKKDLEPNFKEKQTKERKSENVVVKDKKKTDEMPKQ